VKIYAVWGKAWPLNHLFGFFSTRELAQASIDNSPDYKDKLEVKDVDVLTESVSFKIDRS